MDTMTEYKYKLFATALTIVLIAKAITSIGQVGVNGAGFFENRSAQSDEWLHELFDGKEWVLRVPGGAIAKFADPTVIQGWGLTYEGVDSIQIKYGSDEEEATADALAKWHRKTDLQPSVSYLDELIAFSQEFNVKVIWVANIYIPVERSMFAVEYLIENGVNVVAVELGNETYSQVNHDFDMFLHRAEPVMEWCESYGVPYSIPAAPMGNRERRDHLAWNNSVKAIHSGHYITFHRYYDEREFPALNSPVDTLMAYLQFANYDFEFEFNELKAFFPESVGYMVTEFNTQPSNLIGDTDLNAYFLYLSMLAGANSFDYFCIHNGVSPDKYGIIYGKEGEQKRNTSYYAFADVLSQLNPVVCDTIIVPAVYDTIYTEVPIEPDPRCDRFFYRLFNGKACRQKFITVSSIVLVSEGYTEIDCGD